jgi:transmembrane sensor
MESINEKAARWVVRTDTGRLYPSEQQELAAWLVADPRHRGAYVRARAQWLDLDRLAALNGPQSDVVAKVGTRRRPPRRALVAASIAAIAITVGGSWLILGAGTERYTSGIGEQRRLALEDGSTLLLNTASEVTVAFSRQHRNIRLVRGEVLFEVAHDKARPFIVVADETAVRAVGTAFVVRLESARVDVTVTEGVVEVANSTVASLAGGAASKSSEPEPMRVLANERLVIAGQHAAEVLPIVPAEADRQLAWRGGLVSFDGESLQTAVEQINRHNRRQIVIGEPFLAAKPIVGVFRATDLVGFAASAAAALQARAIPDGDTIRLEPAPSKH